MVEETKMVSMSQQVGTAESGNEADQRLRPAVRGGTGRGEARATRTILTRTVERDVIPVLVAMPWIGGGAAVVRKPREAMLVDGATVSRLLSLCLDADGLGAATFVAGLHASGVPAETIYTALLSPVALRLGEMWEEDECNFADVTLGVLRLQNAQRSLTDQFVGRAVPGVGAPRALLMPVPGEQHTFGLSIVVDFFCRAGWDARSDMVSDESRALKMVRAERADLIGLSFACDERIGTAERLIAEFRRVSLNPNLVVMVGGPSFTADPGLCARVGADGTAADGHQAVLLAHELVHGRTLTTQSSGAGHS